MKKNVRKEFVEEVRKMLPDNTNAALYLVNQLGLGKETVYRRLRGSVPFTLDEAVSVARDLGISIDRLVGITTAENAGYEFRINYFRDFSENYTEILSSSLKALDAVTKDPAGIYIFATNQLPYRLYAPYKALSEFRLRRWLYEREQIGAFSEENTYSISPEHLANVQRVYEGFRNIEGTYLILDENVFRSVVKELRYFKLLSSITDREMSAMKEELLDMLDKMETMMVKGRTPAGKRIYFYLSNVLFDTSYSYMEARDFQISYFHVYAMHLLESESPEICSVQKKWLQTILRHSTLITQSGEIERTAYLKEQRAIVESL